MDPYPPPSQREPDDNHGPVVVAVFIIQCGIALLFLILRLWARCLIHTLGWDDFFMTLTWIIYAMFAVFTTVVAAGGGYRHAYYLEPVQAKHLTRLNWISQSCGIAAQTTGKVAVCFLLLRIFGAVSRYRKYLIWWVMALNVVVGSLSIIITYVQCRDPAALWDPDVRARTECWDTGAQTTAMISLQAFNCVFDFVLALIPASFIWRLRFTLLKRLGLILSLSGGMLSGICAAFKITTLPDLGQRLDFLRGTAPLFIWCSCEVSVIILCGCIPTLMPLWDRCERNIRSLVARSRPPSNAPGDAAAPAPQQRRCRPTCPRRGFSIELSGCSARSDAVVSSLGAKAFGDAAGHSEPREPCSQSSTSSPTVPKPAKRGSIQVTYTFQVDYSNPDEA
ncbi:hypothetical protein GGR52DRAFT_592426 [Hypoxylon sp. FL1284]|nr:hypothetical protein GGR52DRAFT_592426 [Hypoxylon sp. FL1284]